MARISLHDAEHPLRQKAIAILEKVIEQLHNPKELDGEKWYLLEDAIVEILNTKNFSLYAKCSHEGCKAQPTLKSADKLHPSLWCEKHAKKAGFLFTKI